MEAFVEDFVLPYLVQDEAHNLNHFVEVKNLAEEACKDFELEPWQRECVITAAFLHDLDDKKLQKDGKEGKWVDYVLLTLDIPQKDIIQKIIDLVSCSKWGDRTDEVSPDWYYIVRYCDRLTAIGKRGLERCLAYTKLVGNPVHTNCTRRVSSLEEFKEVASRERYLEYTNGKKSESVVDHVYDKLYHISLPDWLKSSFLSGKYEEEEKYLVAWVIDYWKNCSTTL